ncbi:MAG: hypothetical protein KBS55_02485 [Bacteroidales bacterium]|nr:hypothetical protein [Candidatus Cryptobacteroides aphodequi]
MIRRSLTVLLAGLVATLALAGVPALPAAPGADVAPTEGPDSPYAGMDGLLEQYYVALLEASNEEKESEMDYLITTCRDSLLRQHIACAIFAHYKESPLMGEEAVALHVYDRWFADGTVTFPTDQENFEAEMFALFNRSSMLYMQAPVLGVTALDGSLPDIPEQGRLCALYFYDTSCTKCNAVTPVLPYALEAFYAQREADCTPLTLYMFYSGSDEEAWRSFAEGFDCASPQVEVVHVWDPDAASDYLRKYAVLSTPQLFLVTPGGMIIGRRLEVENLVELLDFYYLYEHNAKEKK